MKMSSKKSKGFTLIDLLLTLVVIGVLAALAYPKVAKAMSSSKGQSLGADVVSLANDLQSGYQGNYAAIGDAAIISGSLLKNVGTITNNAGVLLTNMGGTVTSAPAKLVTNNDSFALTITSVKDGACTSLANSLGRAAVKLTVGAVTVKAPGAAMDSSKITCAGDNTDFVATFS